MKIDNAVLVAEFYEWLKENYEIDLSLAEVKDIINAPFAMLKSVMSSGTLTSVRFMGFGLFFVYPKKVKGALNDLQKRYENGNLPHNSFIKYYRAFKTYLDNNEKTPKRKKTD